MFIPILFLIGRIIFGIYWLMQAYNHFKNPYALADYAKNKSVPYPRTAVIGTGVLLLLGGLSMLFGIYIKIGILLLVIFLLGVTFAMHAYWKDADPMVKVGNRVNFYKNLALLGALLMMLAIPMPWWYSVVW